MNHHRKILAAILDEIIGLDPDCSIVLGGSMARDEEREDSDIDLFVFLSREPARFTDLIARGNRNRWHTYTKREGIAIDLGWDLLNSLPDEIPDSKEMVPYAFVRAKIIRDPSGKVGLWVQAMRHWLDRNQWVEEVWSKSYEEMRHHKKDPSYPLKYDEQGFIAHLRELVARRGKRNPQHDAPAKSPRAAR